MRIQITTSKNILCLLILMMGFIHNGYSQSLNINSRLFERSKAAYAELDLKKAERLCLKAMDKDDLNDHPDAQLLLANIYFAQKSFDDSKKLYYKILSNLDIVDSRTIFLQNAISRSQKNLKHMEQLRAPRLEFEEEVVTGIVNLNDFEKITSLDSMAVYPGCEDSKDQKTTDKCLHYFLHDLITFNFDKKVLKEIGMNVPVVIYTFFTITNEGALTDTEIYAPHPSLELEGMRILHGIPKLVPAMINGNAIAIKESMHVHISN